MERKSDSCCHRHSKKTQPLGKEKGVFAMKKTLLTLIGILLVAFLGLVVLRDGVAKVAVESGVRIATGLPLNIGSLHIGLRNVLVHIKDMRVGNPQGYSEKTMADIPEIYFDVSVRALLKGKIHVPAISVELKEFLIVKNAAGDLNLNEIKGIKAQQAKAKTGAPEPSKKGKAPEAQIDSLELKIDKVVFKDYSKGATPAVTEFNINVDEKYSDVKNFGAIVSLIVLKAMTNSTIATLANFDVDSLKGSVSGLVGSSAEIMGDVTAKTTDALKQTAQQAQQVGSTLKQSSEGAQQVAGEVKDAAKKATEELSSVAKGLTGSLKAVKLPFGKTAEEEKPN